MKKILFITPFVPDDHGGGTSYTKCLLSELTKFSIIDLVYFRYENSGQYVCTNSNIKIVKEYTIKKFDKLFSLLSTPWLFPLFTARFIWNIKNELQQLIVGHNISQYRNEFNK